MPKKLTIEEFIIKANIAHSDRFTYDKSVYVNMHTNIIITCPIHGDFEQRPVHHINGFGCSKCNGKHQHSTEEFINKASLIHNNLYDYSKSIYKNKESKLTIICPIHGEFEQRAGSHLRGKGCWKCRQTGFDYTEPGILYYLKINGGQAYKIGVTNSKVENRFSNKELEIIEILATRYYPIGMDAYNAEQSVIKDYKEFKYTGDDLLVSGNTELFNKDILNIDPMYLY